MGDLAQRESPFPLTEVDKWVLSQTDEEYQYHDWDELKRIIGEIYPAKNELDVLKRKPSDLRRYMQWTAETKAQYGSIANFILAHRLPRSWGSPPLSPASQIPFQDPSDYAVLANDWPYGVTQDITHLVIWSRTPIEVNSRSGDLTPSSRRIVVDFVKRTFVNRLGADGEERVLWFKNWVALQSVRALEHIHILVRNADQELIEEWTRGIDNS